MSAEAVADERRQRELRRRLDRARRVKARRAEARKRSAPKRLAQIGRELDRLSARYRAARKRQDWAECAAVRAAIRPLVAEEAALLDGRSAIVYAERRA